MAEGHGIDQGRSMIRVAPVLLLAALLLTAACEGDGLFDSPSVAVLAQPPHAVHPHARVRRVGGEVLESNTPLDVEVALRLIESLGSHS